MTLRIATPLALGLGAGTVLVLALELGPLGYARHAGLPADALDVLRALSWPVAALGGLGVALAAWRRPSPAPPPTRAQGWAEVVLTEMSEGVVVLDADGRIVRANPAAGRLLGVPTLPDGLPMQVLAEVPRLRTTAVEAMRSGVSVTRELVAPGRPARHVLVRASPMGAGVALVLHDVTDLRSLEQGWRDFVGNAAHELRTPAAAVLANLDLLDQAPDLAPDRRARLSASALRQARRLSALVDQLMALVRLDGGLVLAREPVRLGEVVARIVDELAAVDADQAGRVVVDVPEAIHVLGDRGALEQVANNLVANALTHAAGPVRVSARAEGQQVRWAIRDQGPGVPDPLKERVFERFFRVDEARARGGTGLGLAITHELVAAMGGQVHVEDADPHGAVFVVTLDGAARSAHSAA